MAPLLNSVFNMLDMNSSNNVPQPSLGPTDPDGPKGPSKPPAGPSGPSASPGNAAGCDPKTNINSSMPHTKQNMARRPISFLDDCNALVTDFDTPGYDIGTRGSKGQGFRYPGSTDFTTSLDAVDSIKISGGGKRSRRKFRKKSRRRIKKRKSKKRSSRKKYTLKKRRRSKHSR